jgi:putative ABC transport system permease protein
MVLLEAVGIAIIGFATGAISGLLNAYFLVNAATRIAAGFTLPLIFPLSMVLIAIPVVVVVAIVSAVIPARNAARINVVEAIGYE